MPDAGGRNRVSRGTQRRALGGGGLSGVRTCPNLVPCKCL